MLIYSAVSQSHIPKKYGTIIKAPDQTSCIYIFTCHSDNYYQMAILVGVRFNVLLADVSVIRRNDADNDDFWNDDDSDLFMKWWLWVCEWVWCVTRMIRLVAKLLPKAPVFPPIGSLKIFADRSTQTDWCLVSVNTQTTEVLTSRDDRQVSGAVTASLSTIYFHLSLPSTCFSLYHLLALADLNVKVLSAWSRLLRLSAYQPGSHSVFELYNIL